MNNFLEELRKFGEVNKKENKEKLHKLLDKYGSLENFMENSTLAEDLEYKFAQGDSLIDEVQRERSLGYGTLKLLHNNVGSSYSLLSDTSQETKLASNEHSGIKTDASVENGENNKNKYIPSIGFDDIYHSKLDDNGYLYKGIKEEEGGYSNRVVDEPTNYGVTQNSLNEYNRWKSPIKKGNNFPTNVKNLQPIQAKQILDEMYYQRYGINKIKKSIIKANVLDHEINAGPIAGYILSDAMNEHSKNKFAKNYVINDCLANNINELSLDDIIKLNDLYTMKRMDYYFNVIDNKPYKINNLNGWYNRAKKFYSSGNSFDELYNLKRNDYFHKYHKYYIGR